MHHQTPHTPVSVRDFDPARVVIFGRLGRVCAQGSDVGLSYPAAHPSVGGLLDLRQVCQSSKMPSRVRFTGEEPVLGGIDRSDGERGRQPPERGAAG